MEAVRLFVGPLGADVRSALKLGTLVACWQVQSKLAALTLLLLVAVSVWWALLLMLIWSIVATWAYVVARERGVPDILALTDAGCSRARRTGTSLGQIWLVGLNAFVFARAFRPYLERPAHSLPRRAGRLLLIAAGLTVFGVTIAQHLLYHAGFRGSQLLLFGVLGSFLNVPFRVLCGAMTVQLVLAMLPLDAKVPLPW